MGREITQDEAVALSDSGFWKHLSHKERAHFQWFTDRLCMPFSVFHESLEKTLGRGVWSHEMALNRDGITAELLGEGEPPTMEEIMDLIPAEKRIIISMEEGE